MAMKWQDLNRRGLHSFTFPSDYYISQPYPSYVKVFTQLKVVFKKNRSKPEVNSTDISNLFQPVIDDNLIPQVAIKDEAPNLDT
jgi:hypothetical protein